ncbi:MAG: hypothetical protein ACQJCO_06320 [cyanobacterium endosymbiont of Rhopalodia sterrenbergii]
MEQQKQLIDKFYTQLKTKEEMTIQLAKQQQIIYKPKAEVAQKSHFLKSQAVIFFKPKKSQTSRPLRSFRRCVIPLLSNKKLINENIEWFD